MDTEEKKKYVKNARIVKVMLHGRVKGCQEKGKNRSSSFVGIQSFVFDQSWKGRTLKYCEQYARELLIIFPSLFKEKLSEEEKKKW